MDSEADADAAAAFEHDIELLGTEATTAGKKLAKKYGPPLAGCLMLVLVAWFLNRRWTKRHLLPAV